jgi:hypothetical protein
VSCRWGFLASAYFDNELETSERVWFEVHLLSCADCAISLAAFRTIERVFQSIKTERYRLDPSAPFENAGHNQH